MSANSPRPAHHDMMPELAHDEESRQGFVRSMRRIITSRLTPGHQAVYNARVLPKVLQAQGHEPAHRDEITPAMKADPYHQMWSSLLRNTQELMWESIIPGVERQADNLNQRFIEQKSRADALGSLTLNPELELPSYARKIDYHTMPGGYLSETSDDDVTSGALYEQSIHLYMMGGLGDYNDGIGEMLSAYMLSKYPDLKPQRILDMGCTIGHSTGPYTEKYPDAEVHGIDLCAPLLRYGFARSQSMGKAIHFSQQNAECTDFEDNSFDLIVSHIMMHETSTAAVKNILKECRRLVRPGGVVAHLEMLPFSKKTVLQQYLTDWDSRNNNEPFIGRLNELDMAELLSKAGFSDEELFVDFVPIDFQKRDKSSIDYAHLIGAERHIFGAQASLA